MAGHHQLCTILKKTKQIIFTLAKKLGKYGRMTTTRKQLTYAAINRGHTTVLPVSE